MIAVGRITKSVGLKGEVKVEVLAQNADRLFDLQTVFVGLSEQDAVERGVLTARKQGSFVVMMLEGIDTRTKSEQAAGSYLFLPDDQAQRSPGSYFLHELPGLKVVTEEGTEVGTVKEVVPLPGGDTWIVTAGTKEIMIPGVKEFIRSVDLKNRKVVVHLIEGLLE